MLDDNEELERVEAILEEIKDLAQEYYELTGKPLGATGEIGEYWAYKLLGLKLEVVRSPGYDATDTQTGKTIQIKTRMVQKSTNYLGETIGTISFKQPWDTTMVVVLKERFEPVAIYEATREGVRAALARPGSNARARGALTISQFRNHARAKQVWPKENTTVGVG